MNYAQREATVDVELGLQLLRERRLRAAASLACALGTPAEPGLLLELGASPTLACVAMVHDALLTAGSSKTLKMLQDHGMAQAFPLLVNVIGARVGHAPLDVSALAAMAEQAASESGPPPGAELAFDFVASSMPYTLLGETTRSAQLGLQLDLAHAAIASGPDASRIWLPVEEAAPRRERTPWLATLTAGGAVATALGAIGRDAWPCGTARWNQRGVDAGTPVPFAMSWVIIGHPLREGGCALVLWSALGPLAFAIYSAACADPLLMEPPAPRTVVLAPLASPTGLRVSLSCDLGVQLHPRRLVVARRHRAPRALGQAAMPVGGRSIAISASAPLVTRLDGSHRRQAGGPPCDCH